MCSPADSLEKYVAVLFFTHLPPSDVSIKTTANKTTLHTNGFLQPIG